MAAMLCGGVAAAQAPLPPLDCVIEPYIVVDLSSQLNGIVDKIHVNRGDVVRRGQALVKLESSVEEAAVRAARARAEADAQLRSGRTSAEFADRRKRRVETLYVEKAVSPDQMDEIETQRTLSDLQLQQARENRRIAQLELSQAEATLARHTIRSPIDGVVVQRLLSPGESVKDQPILKLAQLDPLRVEVIVPVSMFGEIETGQTAVVRPELNRNREYNANVEVVDRVADAASGTFRVRLNLPNPDYDLPSGLKCQVQIGQKRDSRVAASPARGAHDASEVSAPMCRAIGPIEDPGKARQVAASLREHADNVTLREPADGKPVRYRVLTPPQASRDEAKALAARLKAAGIRDMYVISKGDDARRVALGMFRSEASASRRVADIRRAGFDVKLVRDGGPAGPAWVDLRMAADADAVEQVADLLAALGPGVQVKPTPCDGTLAVTD